MKKISIWVICVLFCQFIMAQKMAVVSAEKFNYLYQGIENPVSIAVPEISSDKIQVSVINGNIKKIDNSHYIVIPGNFKTLTLNVFSVEKKDTVYYGSFQFRVKQIPEHDLYIANTNMALKKKINKVNLLAQPMLYYKISENFEFDIPAPLVLSFNLSYNNKGSVVDKAINGNKISGDIINEIMQLGPDTEIVISNIKVKVNDNVRAAEGCSFTIN